MLLLLRTHSTAGTVKSCISVTDRLVGCDHARGKQVHLLSSFSSSLVMDYQEADVAGDAYAARPWHGEHSYNRHNMHQQFPTLASSIHTAGYGLDSTQQLFPPRSVSLHRHAAQAPAVPSSNHRMPAAASLAKQYRSDPAASAAGTSQEAANDSLKSVRDLPAIFQSLYSFR